MIQYLEAEGVSRYESTIAQMLVKEVNKNNKFTVSYDNFGSVIFHKKIRQTNAPKFMVAAHMDEVGFLVKGINKNGQIKLSSVGGLWPSVVIGTKAVLINSQGKRFNGIFGHTSIHIMKAEKKN